MNDSFETEALRYLLNEMDAGGRAEFEARLARDPAARVALKSCADAIGRFACEQAPAEPMSAADQRATLNAVLAQAMPVEEPLAADRSAVIPWAKYFWPLAAAALLALNLIDFRRPVDAPARGTAEENRDEWAATRPQEPRPGEDAEMARLSAGAKLEATGGEAAETREEIQAEAAAKFAAELAETSRELAKLRGDYAELERTAAALRAEYDTVVQHWASRLAFDRSVGRLAAMELVDAESYARGDRKGLVEVARGILTEPGVIVAADGPIVPGVEPPSSAGIDPTPVAATPYAWAVFDDKEQRGYLNLYNMPAVARDESLQLWVRAADRTAYQRVGEVPAAFYGGAGSVQYRMADGAAPAEILITREPRDAVAEQPVGPMVLRGP